eukprot:CAMPEP_0178766646 /NCGR_PEP_ID=MMETSP0744-20121128/19182_1 /TAXON_ID=913974 /ORGANISM="Nitzschia punctata, Strain CCMP561" /LENGTH=304 /DNA_ID=CAMNT_0020422395 /DNA_START=18 /DNA_END=933 /DNA_ORIENTATION=+
MEETKLQALADSLSKHGGRRGLGTYSGAYSWTKTQKTSSAPNTAPERTDGLPNNALYANFVREGTYDPNVKAEDGDGRVIKRDFSDSLELVATQNESSSSSSLSGASNNKKADEKAKRKAAKKAAKLEAKRQAKLEEKRKKKRAEKERLMKEQSKVVSEKPETGTTKEDKKKSKKKKGDENSTAKEQNIESSLTELKRDAEVEDKKKSKKSKKQRSDERGGVEIEKSMKNGRKYDGQEKITEAPDKAVKKRKEGEEKKEERGTGGSEETQEEESQEAMTRILPQELQLKALRSFSRLIRNATIH